MQLQLIGYGFGLMLDFSFIWSGSCIQLNGLSFIIFKHNKLVNVHLL